MLEVNIRDTHCQKMKKDAKYRKNIGCIESCHAWLIAKTQM
jgi:hypothetical protein